MFVNVVKHTNVINVVNLSTNYVNVILITFTVMSISYSRKANFKIVASKDIVRHY